MLPLLDFKDCGHLLRKVWAIGRGVCQLWSQPRKRGCTESQIIQNGAGGGTRLTGLPGNKEPPWRYVRLGLYSRGLPPGSPQDKAGSGFPNAEDSTTLSGYLHLMGSTGANPRDQQSALNSSGLPGLSRAELNHSQKGPAAVHPGQLPRARGLGEESGKRVCRGLRRTGSRDWGHRRPEWTSGSSRVRTCIFIIVL